MQVDDDHVTGRSVKELEIFKAKEDKALIDLWILAEKQLIPQLQNAVVQQIMELHALHLDLWTGSNHAIRLRKYRGRKSPLSLLSVSVGIGYDTS
jgi:hypothetical protein